MKFKKPVNENYCGTVVQIKSIIPLENCDNIQATIIFGNRIIVSKETNVGDVGIYFPAETQLSHEYAHNNNLYRHTELNIDNEKTGYLEDNRRIRTMKLRGNQSCGLFMPLDSLAFCVEDFYGFDINDSFDELNCIPICNKYIVKTKNSNGPNKGKNKNQKESKIVDGQFRFHEDTAQFGKNVHNFNDHDTISITYKLHGTSVVISKILCKKKLGIFSKFLKFIGFNIVDKEYDNIYSSRKVIKNDDISAGNHFYNVDIWKMANDKIKDFLLDGMTVYAEIVGFLPNGSAIQKMKKAYDYGCNHGEFKVYIYRITYTNPSGNVFEFSAKQVQDWCKENGLNAVPELYYGKVMNFWYGAMEYDTNLNLADNLLTSLREVYLEGNCFMCKNKVPAEGIVIRKETNRFDAFKFKSFLFLEGETKQLDKGESNIEDDN